MPTELLNETRLALTLVLVFFRHVHIVQATLPLLKQYPNVTLIIHVLVVMAQTPLLPNGYPPKFSQQ